MSKKHREKESYVKSKDIVELAIDSHSHITKLETQSNIVSNMREDGICKIINMVSSLAELKEATKISEKNRNVYFMFGLHPYDAEDYGDAVEQAIVDLSKYNTQFVGIGEIGLDYHVETPTKLIQQETFVKQIKLANKLNLPISIHIRDAHSDAMKILQENKDFLTAGGIIHCFTGTVEDALNYVELGFYISFSGTVTFKKKGEEKTELQRAVEAVPLNRLLIETDAPYLCPSPYRGLPNEPKYVLLTAQEIATLKNIEINELIKITRENTERVLRLK